MNSFHKTLAIAGLAIAALAAVAWAQNRPGPQPHGGMMMHGGGMADGCPMCGMMLGRAQLVETNDGVIVMLGNKLYKYDRDLNLKKEVELKLDVEAMMRAQQQIQRSCPQRPPAAGTPAPGQ